MPRYRFKVKETFWGRCKRCFKAMDDLDHIYGQGHCRKCNLLLARRKLREVCRDIDARLLSMIKKK